MSCSGDLLLHVGGCWFSNLACGWAVLRQLHFVSEHKASICHSAVGYHNASVVFAMDIVAGDKP